MKEEFEKLVAAGKISKGHVQPLVHLTQCGYCIHRSWGFGKIMGLDTVAGRFLIDFQSRPGHSMDLAFAAENLRSIPAEHILARKAANLEELRTIAATNHLELIRIVLESYGGQATVDQVQQVLVPDVITEDWRKWWEVARREMRKSGHFQMPLKKSDPIVFQAKVITQQERLVGEFRSAKGLKARLVHVHEIIKNFTEFENGPTAVAEVMGVLNPEIINHQRTVPDVALEAIFLRDELRAVSHFPVQEGEVSAREVWMLHPQAGPVIELMSSTKHKQALQSFKEAYPDQWVQSLLGSLNSTSAKFCHEATQILVAEGHLQELKESLSRLINQHLASSELLLWLARERSDAFADILGPEVFRAMLSAIERDQFNEIKSNRLRDYVLDDQELIVELIESADLEVIKDLTRLLKLSPVFDDMDKRSLLGRMVKSFPAIQLLISGEHPRQESNLVVSWPSLERKKDEYTDLVHKKIPANSKEIAIARSYGDLRENHEYKAAKEMQKLLLRQKAELEADITRARGNDFLNPRLDVVSIGVRVRVTEMLAQHQETFAILGAWDFDLDKGIISYLSPMAQAMLNHVVGDEVDFGQEPHLKRYRIDAIEPLAEGTIPTSTSA